MFFRGGVLQSNVSNYVEYLFIWRLLCELMNEEDDDLNIHPDFHEFITYVYRLIKLSVNEKLTPTKEFLICQNISILSTFDMLDIYRRKCIEAMGRCLLVHFGQYESIVKQAFHLIHRVHPSIDSINERYKLITYTLNDIIQRCQNQQLEQITFIQCMTIAKVFIEQEKQLELNNTDLKQLLNSLVREIEKPNEFNFFYLFRLNQVCYMENLIFNLKLYQHYVLLCVILDKQLVTISNKIFISSYDKVLNFLVINLSFRIKPII
jgi:hypothetical protein